MSEKQPYFPPQIWKWKAANGGRFSKINRPTAGSTHDQTLPIGKHPLQLYSQGTPNGVKVTILLEELLEIGKVDAEYDAWLIRINPKVQGIFKEIWKTDKLVVSFDGCCYIPKDCEKKDNCWTHTDQGPKLKGLTCYQGFISLTENKERTLLLYKGSHKEHEKYFSDRGLNGSKNWCLIDKDYLSEIDHMKIKLHVPKGALVIWDSRVFHQNTYGLVQKTSL